MAGEQQLRRQGEQADGKIDAGENARLEAGALDRLGHDMRLLEIDDGRGIRQQADPGAYAQQIWRAHHFREAGEGAAAYLLRRRPRPGVDLSRALEAVDRSE